MHGQRHKTNQNEPKRCVTTQHDTTGCKLKETKNKQLNETEQIQTAWNQTTHNDTKQRKLTNTNTTRQNRNNMYIRKGATKQSRPTQPIKERGNARQIKRMETKPHIQNNATRTTQYHEETRSNQKYRTTHLSNQNAPTAIEKHRTSTQHNTI